ncbi:hypothetical protein QUF72_12255 [Desulfobacterales bacterium HSG2]|nr:hypothetical protein [Desulfobacterales bacterium HSG2]
MNSLDGSVGWISVSEMDEMVQKNAANGKELTAASEETDAQAGCVNEFTTELTALSIFLKNRLRRLFCSGGTDMVFGVNCKTSEVLGTSEVLMFLSLTQFSQNINHLGHADAVVIVDIRG